MAAVVVVAAAATPRNTNFRCARGDWIARHLNPVHPMVFRKELREGVRRGRIRCTVRVYGPGENLYLIRFHYLPPGGWDRR